MLRLKAMPSSYTVYALGGKEGRSYRSPKMYYVSGTLNGSELRIYEGDNIIFRVYAKVNIMEIPEFRLQPGKSIKYEIEGLNDTSYLISNSSPILE